MLHLGTDRGDKAPADGELVKQCLGHFETGRSQDDPVEGSSLRQA